MRNFEKAKELKAIRKDRLGWTQTKMALALEIDATYLSQLENARVNVDEHYVTKARQIAEEFAKSKHFKVSDALQEGGQTYGSVRERAHVYLDEVMDGCEGNQEELTWTYVELKKKFPLKRDGGLKGGSAEALGKALANKAVEDGLSGIEDKHGAQQPGAPGQKQSAHKPPKGVHSAESHGG